MLNYEIIGIIVGLNLILYLLITLPLDYGTYKSNENSRIQESQPDPKQDLLTTLTYIASLLVWLLFLVIPIENLMNINISYSPLLKNLALYGFTVQVLGLVLISGGTLIAVGGRISRGKRAFSWGVPIVLETGGMYRYIRHPLYASYCFYFIGFLFSLQNLLLIFLLLGIPGYYYISIYEEEFLIQQFGQEYRDYQKKVKRFIPFIW
ncbi:MAG: methyltransferase family protein [Candidatus Hodarchaeales archaeon]|jgi:protein-S-isoprenylcysteine O-methyltransferase Ste14